MTLLIASLTLSTSGVPLSDPVYIFCTVLLVIAIAPWIAQRSRVPTLVVLIVLGAVLGTHGIGILARDQQLMLLEKIGLLYIMLLAGLQINLSNFQRLGTRSLVFGLLTFGVPFTVGILSGQVLTSTLLASVLLGILYSPHTLVSYPLMTRLGIVQHESVAVAIGGTIVTSILTLMGLSLVKATSTSALGWLLWIKLLVLLPILVGLCFWGIPKLGRLIFKPSTTMMSQFIFVLSCLFVVAAATQLLGLDSIVGAFIAGLALNSLIPSNHSVMEQIEFVGNSLFIPAFLISVGVLCNPQVLVTNPENLGVAIAVITGAVGAKFLASWLAGQVFKYAFADVMVMFGLTMSRAALVLVIALFAQQASLITEGLFNAIMLYVVVTCLTGPLVCDAYGKQLAAKNPLAEQRVL